jgi:hypothetical protein
MALSTLSLTGSGLRLGLSSCTVSRRASVVRPPLAMAVPAFWPRIIACCPRVACGHRIERRSRDSSAPTPSPNASPFAQSRCRCGRGEPSPAAGVAQALSCSARCSRGCRHLLRMRTVHVASSGRCGGSEPLPFRPSDHPAFNVKLFVPYTDSRRAAPGLSSRRVCAGPALITVISTGQVAKHRLGASHIVGEAWSSWSHSDLGCQLVQRLSSPCDAGRHPRRRPLGCSGPNSLS